MWPITLLGRLPIVDLVGRYLTNYLIGREPTLYRIAPLTPVGCPTVVSCGIRIPFGILSPCRGQVAHALLTRPPLTCEIQQAFIHKSARLACVRHAASVRPEPGSNSSVQSFKLSELHCLFPCVSSSLYRFQGPPPVRSRGQLDHSITEDSFCQAVFGENSIVFSSPNHHFPGSAFVRNYDELFRLVYIKRSCVSPGQGGL